MTALDYIHDALDEAVKGYTPITPKGRVLQVAGTVIRAITPRSSVGEVCLLQNPGSDKVLPAEVVGFDHSTALLAPMGEMRHLSPSTMVTPTGDIHRIEVGPHLRGRVLDGLGNPIDLDTGAAPSVLDRYSVNAMPPDPLSRKIISKPLALGVKAIDAFMTCGEGQRMGIFAAAGGGKSTLLAMLVKGAAVDVTVLALIGERGREVREFMERDLGPEGMARSVLVVATSDRPSMERAKAAYVATAVAEYFRDEGKRVLLLMDSVTRFARALREIGLASGEPPTRRGFPPSVFATLPKLMERSGQSDKGSITALYTVLVEGDDMTEPVADETRSILDGHIILSRKLAAANHYPAIDILASTSRVMNAVTDPDHREAAAKLRQLLAKYDEVELLLKIGEYQQGNDPEADRAIAAIEPIRHFLRQSVDERVGLEEAVKAMQQIV